MRVGEAALLPACASIIVFCWGVVVSLMVSVVELIHGGGTHFRIVTAIKSKEKPILHHEIDKRFGLCSFRLIGSLFEVVWKDGMSKSGAVCESWNDVLLYNFTSVPPP